MTQKKLKLIVQAVTVFAILLLCFMLIFLTVQFVSLNKLKKKKANLDNSLKYLNDYTGQVSTQIDYLENDQALQDMYRSLGYNKDSDVPFRD